jgi:hypothetical protein
MSASYSDAALRFACTEEQRKVLYNRRGDPGSERLEKFPYLLVDGGDDFSIDEHRGGSVSPGSIEVPPPLTWAMLFDDPYRSYFSFRDLGNDSSGFDEVRRIQFRGSLPYARGDDIREWEGILTLQNDSLLPLSVVAEPRNQSARLEDIFLKEQQSFRITISLFYGNLFRFLTGKKPLGKRCHVRFEYQRNGLTLPVEYQLERFRAVGRRETVPKALEIRNYRDYRFFSSEAIDEVNEQ